MWGFSSLSPVLVLPMGYGERKEIRGTKEPTQTALALPSERCSASTLEDSDVITPDLHTIPTSFLVYTNAFFTLPAVVLPSFLSGVEKLEKELGWRVSRSSGMFSSWSESSLSVFLLVSCLS